MNFSRGHSRTKVQCESCLFPQGKKHQNSQKWAKFMNFSFWPFLWFGLPGRLLIIVLAIFPPLVKSTFRQYRGHPLLIDTVTNYVCLNALMLFGRRNYSHKGLSL